MKFTIKDLCALIEEITKTKIKILSDKKRIRPKAGEVYRLKADNKKARKLLGWKPLYSGKSGLKKGLKETIDWFSDPANMNRYKT